MNEASTDFQISRKDIQQAKELLSKLQPGQLPFNIFIEVARLTVTPIIEIVPLRTNADGYTEVLLTKREDSDPIWPGMLHTPGTVVRANDRDDNSDAFRRILNGELGDIKTSAPVYVKTILHKVKRGTEQAQIFWVEVHGESKIGIFYDVNKLPGNIIDSQIDFIKAATDSYIATNH
ncbi:MAG: hypothetical protein WCH58_02220 [Candidatus Saccharibacteria bacterium]